MSENGEKLEMRLGLFLAIFAAILAISDLYAGKYGDDEIISHNEQTKAYNWYQSKSVKQGMEEGHYNILKGMVVGGMVKDDHKKAVDSLLAQTQAEIKRYKKEKNEILKGSSAIDKAEWIQEKDGKLGQIVGADQWGEKAEKLGVAGDNFDLAGLFLQLCLVIGAVGLVLQGASIRNIFFWIMFVLGSLGTFFTVKAYLLAIAVG